MNIRRLSQIVFMLLMLLVSGAKVSLAADVTTSDITINYTNPTKGSFDVSVGALGASTTGCYRVTLTANPATGYGISTANIIVQPLVDPASTRSNNPGIANNLTVSGSGTTFYFDLPERYHGAQVTATFTEKSLTEISSLSEIDDPNGCYKIQDGLTSVSGTPVVTEFKGILDGNLVPFSISGPLFNKVNGGIIKNVIISSASVSGGTNAGAIANEVVGTSDHIAAIYNCGVMSGSVSGTGYVGGIVGLLGNTDNTTTGKNQCYARVINCYSYADIEDGTDRGGIVGYNAYASKSGDIRTMVMNCMFYGTIGEGGTYRSPVYGGKEIDNRANQNGLNTYNYYRYISLEENNKINKYNGALGVEEKYLVRFEYYRQLLNSNRPLAAWYVFGDVEQGKGVNNKMAKWVLDRSVAPYPILKPQGTYPSVVNYDKEYTYNEAGEKIKRSNVNKRSQGKDLGILKVTISDPPGSGKPTGASLTETYLELVRTDKDTLNYNFNYDKVQLPYYNEVGTGNYTYNKVVTGWKITSITGGTTGTYNPADEWGGYNFADRNCTNKDLYDANGSYRVFSQGAYFDVPYGVTAITIEPYWGNAAYVADSWLDITYKSDYGDNNGNNKVVFQQYASDGVDCSINGNTQKVYTSISTAVGKLSGSDVHDNAVVLVGNLHLNDTPSIGETAFTLMSADLDFDNEPDNSLIYHHSGRKSVSQIRFDFLNIPGTAMAQKPKSSGNTFRGMSIFKPNGWFEVTNTCNIYFIQFEYDNSKFEGAPTKILSPVIFQGGIVDQFVSTKVGDPDHHTSYIHVGGNAYFKNFGNGTHSDGSNFTPHIPISVTGGDYDNFYLSGTYKPNATVKADDAECYISGGRFGELAGAAQQQIKGNVKWQIYDADIKNFYGGGVNADKPITGDITVNIFNSYVATFCGGPKFGNMAGVDTENDTSDDKTVRTTAEGCTFGRYFGAGYGGTSYLRQRYYDEASPNIGAQQSFYTDRRGKYYDGNTTTNKDGKEGPGVAADFDYEIFPWSDGKIGSRFYVKFASFSLAKTNDVHSNLKNCIVTGSYYGGGHLGEVTGTAYSELEDCKVYGNVFGGGYSAEVPKVPVRQGGFATAPTFLQDAGIITQATPTGTDEYEWHYHTFPANGEDAINPTTWSSSSDNYIYTNIELTTLGQVKNTNLKIQGNTYVRGMVDGDVPEPDEGYADIDDINLLLYGVHTGGTLKGGVFGGGDASDVTGNTSVLIENTKTEGVNNVFGGGNTADVEGFVKVIVQNGNMENVYGGGAKANTNTVNNTPTTDATTSETVYPTTINIAGGTVNSSVYGGGLGQIASGSDEAIAAVVNGDVAVNVTAGTVNTAVFGGANVNGVLKKKSIVTITGGVVGTAVESGDPNDVVFGGGKGQPTLVEGDVEVNIGEAGQTTGGATINGSVYGGSAMGNVNAKKDGDNTVYNDSKTTSVTLNIGTVNGDIYGGGLGDNTSGSEVAANVYGPVTVTVEGGKAQNVFGCNNKYGTPKSTVVVLVNGTDATVVSEGVKTYALQGVYGGGNLAHYDPTTPGNYPTVTVNGCSTSIKDVFGGGNAAAVPYTSVTINGGDIDRVFAGGNGSNGAANVGFKNSEETPTAGEDEYGTGTSNAIIAGGTINEIYGGSNNKGTVRATGNMNIAKSTAEGACDMKIGSVYGGGNQAPGAAVSLTIGCTGTGDDEGITNVFGGANAANVTGNILLNITEGKIANVFGGNNSSGTVSGTITVNINKAASPCVWNIGNVFGGGKDAAYSAPSGSLNYPEVNIKNGTVSNVFGGGQGSGATVTGNPQVTIGDATTGYDADVTGDVYGGGDAAAVVGTPAVHVINKDNTSIGNVYGGGNAADVTATSVTIDGGTIDMVFGGGHGDKNSDPQKAANVTGDVGVSVTGGTIAKVFGGSNSKGNIGGAIAMEIDKAATASTMRIGEVYGGGNEAAGNAGTITIGCTGTWTDTGEKNHTNANATDNRIGYELEGIGTVYGGANAADVGNNITLNITGGIVENVYGGNNSSGSIDGDITVNIEKGDATCSWYVDNVYGGGNLAAYSQKTAGHPAVNIKNGTVSGNVYGGGKGESAVVTGNPVVTIGDATATHFAIVTGDVYGGGDAAAVTGNTTVTYNDNHASSTVARLFGGGNAAGVSGTSTVTMTLGKVTGGVYGGCNSDGSVGAVTIALNGGQVGTDATNRADVYGGGLGNSTTTTGNIDITLGTDATTGTTVYGDIYGGSALGNVNASASNTTTVTLTSATLYGSVFGGGKGDNASEGEGHSDVTATSNGGATVNINVANTHLTGIYGGANIRGNVKGAIAVNINANVGASGSTLDIFGGGYGANTTTEGNVTVTIGDVAGTKTPEIYGDIYGGSALGNVNNEASDITTVNFLNGTLHGDLYGGGLGNADNAAKVNGQVIVNISNEAQLATNCHIDLRETSIYGCNNANGSPQDDVTVNIYKTDHTSDNGISGTAYAIDQVFGGGDQADYAPENGLATSTKKATVNIIGCNNTIRRVFGGGNAAAAVGVVTRIDGGHFDYVYGGGNGEVTAANIGAGGTNLQIHGGEINNLFGGSNARGTITGNMGVTVDNDCDCGQSGGTAQYVNEFFCGNNLASIGTPENPVTINAKIACGTKFGAVYGGCNLAPLYGSVNLTVEGGVMDYVYGGSKGRLADNSNPTNPIAAVAADISGDVKLTIRGGQIKNVFGGSNINGNIAGSIEVNIEKNDASTCADGWYIGNVYGASNLAAYKPTKTGNTLKVNIKNGTVSGNVYGGGKGTTATVTSNPVVTIGDVTAGHESYEAKVEDKDGDTLANSTEGLVGGNVYGGGDAAPVIGNTTVTLQGKTTVGGDVFGGGNEAPVTGTARVNIQE